MKTLIQKTSLIAMLMATSVFAEEPVKPAAAADAVETPAADAVVEVPVAEAVVEVPAVDAPAETPAADAAATTAEATPATDATTTAETSPVAEVTVPVAPEVIADLNQVVATVNGEQIFLGDVLALMADLPEEYKAQDPKTLFPQLVDQLVSQELIANEADQKSDVLKYKLRQATRAAELNTVLDAYVVEKLTPEYLQITYDDAIGKAPAQPEYNAAHILVKTEEEAKAIAEELKKGGDFTEIAKKSSTDSSAETGGDLGWFGKGQMVPEFETAVAALKKGEVSAPVKSQFGFHIIKLVDNREAKKPTIEEVGDQLKSFATQKLMDDKITSVKKAAEIKLEEGIDPALLNAKF